jgi:WD40 repeat protein
VLSLPPLKVMRQWPAHNGPITDVQIADELGIALSAGADGSALLWDLASGDKVAATTIGSDSIRSASFSKNRSLILINSGGTKAELIRGLGSLVSMAGEARGLATRELTELEKARFAIAHSESLQEAKAR